MSLGAVSGGAADASSFPLVAGARGRPTQAPARIEPSGRLMCVGEAG